MRTTIVAVSGGVDSCVMLHLLSTGSDPLAVVVAHFDHGIRSDSAADARFVEGLAESYGLDFELGRAKLGPRASEDRARQARHDFLESVRDKHGAAHIATAHHKEDIIETAVINILRGTGRRGLSSLRETKIYARPLIDWSKSQIYDYAVQHRLEWVEDSTNLSDRYLRNRVRHRLLPLLKQHHVDMKFEQLVEWFYDHNAEIDEIVDSVLERLAELTSDHLALPISILKDEKLSAELLHLTLRRLGAKDIDAAGIERVIQFGKTARPGDSFNQLPPRTIRKTTDWLLFEK